MSKSSGIARGLANARPPGSAKLANAPSPGLTRPGKCPAVAWGGGGGGWAQVELTDALMVQQFFCVLYIARKAWVLRVSSYPPPFVIKMGDFFLPVFKKIRFRKCRSNPSKRKRNSD